MKLRKNDYIELRKSGLAAITAKLVELNEDMHKSLVLKMKNELKNMKDLKITKKAIATLKTIEQELRGQK